MFINLSRYYFQNHYTEITYYIQIINEYSNYSIYKTTCKTISTPNYEYLKSPNIVDQEDIARVKACTKTSCGSKGGKPIRSHEVLLLEKWCLPIIYPK